MYAIAVTAQVQSDKFEEATSIFRDMVVPAYRQLNGFRHAYLLIDPSTGRSLGISVWETEADRNAVQSNGALQEQLAKFAALLAAPPSPGAYDVKVHV